MIIFTVTALGITGEIQKQSCNLYCVSFYLFFFFIQVEALHLGTLMAAHGYFFPISDHVLTLKDDGTFYRFQVRKSIYRTLSLQHQITLT